MKKELTPRKKQALEMRSRIQNVALELFDKEGFENVSVEQIAQAVGCSVGNIYHYFKSKDELVIQVTSSVDAQYSVLEESFHFGNTTFNYTTNEIRTGNNKVLITSRQADLLRILATNLNLAVDRDLLLETVWGTSSYANSLALNVQVTYLRKALHNDPSTGIVSLPKKGYMLRG